MSLYLHLLLFIFVGLSQALFEDQINKFDWKREYIGKIEDVVFDGSLSISKNLYVITEKRVLASLSAKNGQINWRHVLDEKLAKLVQFGDSVVTITEDGMVRAWDPATGLLKWDVHIPSENKEEPSQFKLVDVSFLDLSYTEGNLMVVLSTDALYTIRFQTGAKTKFRLKSVNLDHTDNTLPSLFVDSQLKQIAVLYIRESSRISASFYDAKTLEVESEHIIPTPWMDDVSKVIVAEGNKLVYVSKAMEALYVVDLLKGAAVSNEPLSALDIPSDAISMVGLDSRDVAELGQDFFFVLRDGTVVHCRMEEENRVSVVTRETTSTDANIQVIAERVGNERYYFIVSTAGKTLRISAHDIKTGSKDKSLDLKYDVPDDKGLVEKLFINMFLKRTTPVGYRLLVTTSDDSVIMLTQPTRLAWSREESLSSVVAAEMLDLPLSDIEAGIEVEFEQADKLSIFHMFFNRISAQIGQVKSFAKQLTRGIKEGTLFERKTKDPLIQVEGLTRDPFSLHKMLVLVTRSGKLFGVDSLSGEIIWRLYALDMNGLNLRLYIQRTTAHFPNPPSALLLGINSDGDNHASIIIFNPITGALLSKEPPYDSNRIIQSILLPFTDAAYLRPLLLLDDNRKFHLAPNTEEIRTQLDQVKDSIFLYSVDRETGLVQGYRFVEGATMEVTWSIQVPADQEVMSVEGKDAYEKVDSMGRPLADRSVIYKYLNPNLIAIVTGSRGTDSVVTVYLIDGVSGHIIHTAVHKKATGPVYVVHSENWLLYSYWNSKSRRTELGSIELYEGKTLYNATTFSSFDSRPGGPVVIQQGYIFPSSINAMSVSKTEKGLTTRQILFGMTRGGVLGMPRRMFDPRRPLHAEQSHREEGLFPYAPEVMIHPSLFLNYNKTIHGITAIYSCPSALESTSIILVTGLDLFFTRTQPSKMFDVLKDDFDHILIVAVLSGMFIAAVATRKLAQNKTLNKAWR